MVNPRSSWSLDHDFIRNTPVTVAIIGIWIITFLIGFGSTDFGPFRYFILDLNNLPFGIIGLITYPLLFVTNGQIGDIISLLFAGWMMYQFGGSLERGWGIKTYLLFLLGTNIAAALVWELGFHLITGIFIPLANHWFMLASVIVGWAWLNPGEPINIWGILPIKAVWLGWFAIALLYFMLPPPIGPMRFILGLFTQGGAVSAIAYVKYRRTWGWIPRTPKPKSRTTRPLRHPASNPFSAILRPFQEWQRKRRIAKLKRTIHFDD